MQRKLSERIKTIRTACLRPGNSSSILTEEFLRSPTGCVGAKQCAWYAQQRGLQRVQVYWQSVCHTGRRRLVNQMQTCTHTHTLKHTNRHSRGLQRFLGPDVRRAKRDTWLRTGLSGVCACVCVLGVQSKSVATTLISRKKWHSQQRTRSH